MWGAQRVSSTAAACADPLPPTLCAPLLSMADAKALHDRPFSKTQLFCSNLPWSVNGKVRLRSGGLLCTPHAGTSDPGTDRTTTLCLECADAEAAL